MAKKGSSLERVTEALKEIGHPIDFKTFPDGTRTSEEAAAAVGCDVGQIAKSLVFRGAESGRAILVVASGANRVDTDKIAEVLGEPLERADGRWVRETTGFAIGGVAPIGHTNPVVGFIDADLFKYERVWAAAGSPNTVFETLPQKLVVMTDGQVVQVC